MLGIFRKHARRLVETISGCDFERLDSRSFAMIDKRDREGAWFSYRAQVRSIIERFRIDLVIDVGANEGQFAQGVRAFYDGEILSFEPVASVFEKLAAAASGDARWHVHKLALGSQESMQAINVSAFTNFSSLLTANDYCAQRFGEVSQGKRQEMVLVKRLDTLLESLVPDIERRHIFLKMDTQGYDTEVFKGLGTRHEHVRALQSEVSLVPIYEGMPHWTESISNYEKAGFGVVGMFPVTRDAGRVIEYDCLLVRP